MKGLTINELHKKVEQWQVKGFLADDEGEALWQWARELSPLAPCLEIGSYCGKSTIYLAEGCAGAGGVVYSVDHHRGSEEHQLGEAYHDIELYDAQRKTMDSFPCFRQNMALFEIEEQVIPIVCRSDILVKAWSTPLSLVFIDGGHSLDSAMHDCLAWSQHLVPGGMLAVHDIFEHPEDGGQGPYLGLQAVLKNTDFQWLGQVRSLGLVRRK